MAGVGIILQGFDRVSVALGITMTVSYGTLFYSFAILAPAIMADFGWSRTFVFGAFSLALVSGAFAAPVAGRLLDRYGGRAVLSVGAVLASLALASLWFATTPAAFIACLFLVEGMAALVLYEAGFAALAQIYGRKARARITAVTLIAGFSSTVFWPLTSFLLSHYHWREVYLWLAAITLLATLPLHLGLPGRKAVGAAGGDVGESGRQEQPQIEASRRRVALTALAVSFASNGFVIAAVQTHFPRLFIEAGYSVAAAASFGAMIGPSQVGARIIESLAGSRHHPVTVGIAANGALAIGAGLLFLIASGPAAAAAFAILYGAGQGLAYIIRGQIPLALFGPEGYGKLTGDLGFIRILVTASAPVTVAFISDGLGNGAALAAIFAMAVLSVLSLLPLQAIIRKQPSG